MKITAFFLLLAISGFSQPVLVNFDPLKEGARIKGIVSDEPKQQFDFIYDNSGAIYQYKNDIPVEVFQLEDEISHLFVSSDGLMYITLDSTNRLLIFDYKLKEPVNEIDKEYKVQFINDDYMMVSFRSTDHALNGSYRSGLLILDRQTFVIKDSLLHADILENDNGILLIRQVKDWNNLKIRSIVYTLDSRTLQKKDTIVEMKDIIGHVFLSQSSDSRFVTFIDNTGLSIFDTNRKIVTQRLRSANTLRNSGFINNDQLFVRSSGNSKNYLEIVNLTSSDRVKYEMNRGFKDGKILFHCNKNYVIAYSQKSNIVQKFQF